ncbi:MAG: hypothetical protein Q9170_006071, partial [Blastenia crenularia]
CALRQTPCGLDDSRDIRIHKRRKGNVHGSNTDTPQVQQQLVTDRGRQNDQLASTGAPTDINVSTTSVSRLPNSFPPHDNTTSSAGLPTVQVPQPGYDTTTSISGNLDGFLSLDPLFGLGADGIDFLDQVFMGEHDWEVLGLSDQPKVSENHLEIPTTHHAGDQTQNGQPYNPVTRSTHDVKSSNLCQDAGIDSDTLETALHAYFDKAALCLPILVEDAFWVDYGAGRCSLTLIYAVACRGMPFTAVEEKWQLQQHLGRNFRSTFLEAQQTTSRQRLLHLDELEALALMYNFEFEDGCSSALSPRLGSLFLTHDSLILMTLEIYDSTRGPQPQNSGSQLARAEERTTLLFWHVYGLDAFHCLDRKYVSRIQDDHAEFAEQRSRKVKGYLDTILALAIIARQIVQRLYSTRAKRKGVSLHDIEYLYTELQHWHEKTGLGHLQSQGSECAQSVSVDIDVSSSSAPSSKRTRLQHAVLGFLELNCYMQIESNVTQNGVKHDTLEGEILVLRVGYETLRAINRIAGTFQWEAVVQSQDQGTGWHSLVDLAPQIIRNICAGVCIWMCHRGQTVQHAQNEEGNAEMANYAKIANKMRDAVASATSHKDTEAFVARLDEQIGLFKDL